MVALCMGYAQSGRLIVGFDIDDTVLFSEPMFLEAPRDEKGAIDYHWINLHDKDYSLLIDPTAALIHYFRANGHQVFFITARPGFNGHHLAEFLSKKLDMDITVNENLFFSPKEIVNGFSYTTKHNTMKKLNLDMYYGDSDRDMIAGLKADVYPVRIIRNNRSLKHYGNNYFGNTLDGKTAKNPFNKTQLKQFYKKGVGVFGESIYPITW